MTSALFISETPPDSLKLAWLPCNDYGNAQRFLSLSRGLVKWVDDAYWIAFDGKRWSEREGHYRARMVAHEVAGHIHDEVAALGDLIGNPKQPDERALKDRFGDWCSGDRAVERLTALSKWAVQSGEARRTAGMLTQAQAIPDMRAWGEDFDRDPLVYNVQNGTLRFLKGADGWAAKFREGHDPRDMLSRIAEVEFDPDAQCPQWLDRLALIQPDAEQRGAFQRMYGQTLTGLTDGEEFYVHKGRGGDGKSKTHEILADLHGDYYGHASINTFLKSRFAKSGAEHRADLVALAGDIRFVLTDEPPPYATWDGEMLKTVTGGGELTARDAGASSKAMKTFKPRWKLFVEVNPLPSMPGDDKGFRRRMRLLLWSTDLSRIPGGYEPPQRLRERLLAEKSGILNWLIEGCVAWLGDRIVPVSQLERDALNDFWRGQSPVTDWIFENCDTGDPEFSCSSKVLLDDFKEWMAANDIGEETIKKWNATKFGRELTQKQIIGKKDGRGNMLRLGIRLKSDAPLSRAMDAAGGGGGRASESRFDDPLGYD